MLPRFSFLENLPSNFPSLFFTCNETAHRSRNATSFLLLLLLETNLNNFLFKPTFQTELSRLLNCRSLNTLNQQRALNKLPTEFRCRNFVNKHRLSIQICAKRAKKCMQRVHIRTELPFCMPNQGSLFLFLPSLFWPDKFLGNVEDDSEAGRKKGGKEEEGPSNPPRIPAKKIDCT